MGYATQKPLALPEHYPPRPATEYPGSLPKGGELREP